MKFPNDHAQNPVELGMHNINAVYRCMEVGRLARKIIVWNMFNSRSVTEMMDLDSAIENLRASGSEPLRLYHMLHRIR